MRASAPPGTSRWESRSSTWQTDPAARDPYRTKVDLPAAVTHGHLAENSDHGGRPTDLADPRLCPRPASARIRWRSRSSPTRPATSMTTPPTTARHGQARAVPHLPALPEGRLAGDLALDHLLRRPLQQVHGHRLPDRRRQVPVRLRPARHDHTRGRSHDLADAEEPAGRDLHVLLPHPPLHARLLPGHEVALRRSCR
jgi:hypothetical protein